MALLWHTSICICVLQGFGRGEDRDPFSLHWSVGSLWVVLPSLFKLGSLKVIIIKMMNWAESMHILPNSGSSNPLVENRVALYAFTIKTNEISRPALRLSYLSQELPGPKGCAEWWDCFWKDHYDCSEETGLRRMGNCKITCERSRAVGKAVKSRIRKWRETLKRKWMSLR